MPTERLDIDAYLERIAVAGRPAPSLETLAAVHQAHLAAIPFENLDILLGKPITLDVGALQAKMVAGRRGGYCFEQNTLFQTALEGLGFRVSALAARVRAGATAVRPRTHMLLRVDLPAGAYLADVGFGGDGPIHPLPLATGAETWVGADGHRLRREPDGWVLEGNVTGAWTELYAFTLEPQHAVDFVVANHFTSTYPSSPFVNTLTAQRSWPHRRVILRNRELTERRDRVVETTTVGDPDQLLAVLRETFGLSFPPATRFARPGP